MTAPAMTAEHRARLRALLDTSRGSRLLISRADLEELLGKARDDEPAQPATSITLTATDSDVDRLAEAAWICGGAEEKLGPFHGAADAARRSHTDAARQVLQHLMTAARP